MSTTKNSEEQPVRAQGQRSPSRGKRPGTAEPNDFFFQAFADALRDILRDESGSTA